jgi:hypothetical protein
MINWSHSRFPEDPKGGNMNVTIDKRENCNIATINSVCCKEMMVALKERDVFELIIYRDRCGFCHDVIEKVEVK